MISDYNLETVYYRLFLKWIIKSHKSSNEKNWLS